MNRSTLSDINVTPLLDLAFVLLIIFMITTPLMEQKIGINLPDSRRTKPDLVDLKTVKQVAIDAAGRVYLDEQRVEVEELEQQLIQWKNSNDNAAISFRADKNLKYQQIIRVLDAIRESGVKLGLATVPDN
jgi:biopolymer transport protein ExbD